MSRGWRRSRGSAAPVAGRAPAGKEGLEQGTEAASGVQSTAKTRLVQSTRKQGLQGRGMRPSRGWQLRVLLRTTPVGTSRQLSQQVTAQT